MNTFIYAETFRHEMQLKEKKGRQFHLGIVFIFLAHTECV